MKLRLLSTFSFFLLALSSFSQGPTSKEAQVEVEKAKINFGFVRQGEMVQIDYVIKNTGHTPLILKETKVECGCTTTKFEKKPILPGESCILKVLFDTKSKIDRQDRTVTIISNANNSPTLVRFKGVVLKKK